MAQSLTSLSLVQQLSAKVGSATGIQSSIPVGGTNATTLSSSDADIIHAFKIKFQDSSDVVRWTFSTGAVAQTAGGTDVIITGAGQGELSMVWKYPKSGSRSPGHGIQKRT